MFDCYCPVCGCEFFTEEGYNADEDAIMCPRCGTEV